MRQTFVYSGLADQRCERQSLGVKQNRQLNLCVCARACVCSSSNSPSMDLSLPYFRPNADEQHNIDFPLLQDVHTASAKPVHNVACHSLIHVHTASAKPVHNVACHSPIQ